MQLSLNNLTFTYDGADTPVFENLSVTLDTSWRLGLIGRNGRGLEHDPFRLGGSALFIQFVYHLSQCFNIHTITLTYKKSRTSLRRGLRS